MRGTLKLNYLRRKMHLIDWLFIFFFLADEEFYIMKLFRLKIMAPINFTERSETPLSEI